MRHAADEHEFAEEGVRECGPGCKLVTERCSCGLGRRLRVLDGAVVGVEVQFRPTWQWLDVRELLIDTRIPYKLCPACGGGACARCRRLGFLEAVPRRPRHAGVAYEEVGHHG